MESYAHKNLIKRISDVDRRPDDTKAYTQWIKAESHLDLLRANADPISEIR